MALFTGLGADEGLAQIACVAGAQANACTVAAGQTVNNVTTTGAGSTVGNAGTITNQLRTNDPNSGVTNSGSVGTFTRTFGANAGVTNSGAVGSGAAGDGILIQGANPNLTLLPGSNIQGIIDLSGAGTRTLSVGNGLSIANTFVTGPNVINSNGAPFAVNGLQVAVVDPTNLAVQDELLVDLTGGISGTVQNRLGALRNGGVSGVTSNPRPMSVGASGASKYSDLVEDTRRQGWAQAFGSYHLQRGDGGPNVDSDIRLGGLVSGFDGVSSGGTRLGVFFGGSTGNVEADFNSQETDVDSLFGGFYASMLKGNTAIDFALTVGYSDYDRERRVANNQAATGLETARANYDGWFVSPELTLTRPLWSGAQRFEKSLTLRYSGLFLDGFTENGTAAPLSINDRDVHVLQARTKLTMPVVHEGVDGSSNRSAFFIGLEGRAQVGDEDVTGTLLAQNITFNPGGDDAVAGAFAGLEFERTSAGGTTFFASVEGQVETGGGRQASGKAGVKFRF